MVCSNFVFPELKRTMWMALTNCWVSSGRGGYCPLGAEAEFSRRLGYCPFFGESDFKVSFKGNSAKGSLAISIVSGQLRASLRSAKFR